MADREMTQGLAAFAAFLHEQYDLPLSNWIEKPVWEEMEIAQIARALEVLIMEPFAGSEPLGAPDALGLRVDWQLSDLKISQPDWETSWQYALLADMDNASKAAAGGMMTPSDPRQFLLKIRYGQGIFGAFAAHMAEFFCERGPIPAPDELPQRLLRVPGLASASGQFLAGLALMIEKLGFKAFCSYCEDRC